VKDVLSFSLDELREEMLSLEEATFRAKQIFDWIYRKKAVDYSEMTNLPISLRERLFGLLPFPVMEMEERQVAGDGTEKFLWKLEFAITSNQCFEAYNSYTFCILHSCWR
jgi:23S rRNA (adenine2503-C2)-methyltransferase